VREGWELAKLGKVCEVIAGQSPEGKFYNEGGDGVPFYQGKKEFQDKYIGPPKIWTRKVTKEAEAGDVLMSVRAPVGPVNFATEKSCIGRGLAAIRASNRLDRDFLFYFLLSKESEISGSEGAVFASINKAQIEEIEFPLPSLPEQKHIVAILDEAFEGIGVAVANAEKNFANAPELFESYLNSVFSHKGDGWKDTSIGDQVMLQRGFDITKDQQKPGSVPVVSSGGVKSSHDTAMVKAPGVVIGRKGTLGKTFYLEEDFWPHDTTLWVKDFKGNDPRFVYYFFTALDVLHLDTGTANPALNRNQVHPIKIVWPPVERQKPIADKFDALQMETQRLESLYQQKLDALAELKQSILQKAFAGELTAQPEQFLQDAVA
jgi:type I restriction enzyme, S subunit